MRFCRIDCGVVLISKGFLFLGFAVCCLGCSGLELAERTPVGIDFSGIWKLNPGSSEGLDQMLSLDLKDVPSRIRTEEIVRTTQTDPFVFISHDFHILDAKKIYAELGVDSAGLRYEPGVYRDISFGEKKRGLWSIYAGWEGNEMVILSKASGLSVLERFALIDRNRLRIAVKIIAEKEERTIVKLFDRSM